MVFSPIKISYKNNVLRISHKTLINKFVCLNNLEYEQSGRKVLQVVVSDSLEGVIFN